MTYLARACGLTVNGTDLGTQFGLVLDNPAGLLAHPAQRTPSTWIYGADAETVLGGAKLTPREIRIEGTVRGSSAANLVARLDGLKQFLANGELQVASTYDTTRYYKAYLMAAPVEHEVPQFLRTEARFEATLTCPDPMAWATTDTTVNFTTAATSCPLGSAISRAVITITGGTNPLITLANAAGATQETLGFTLTLGVADTIVIDCVRKTITKTISSVTSNAIADATTNTAYTFLALDPADGVQLSGTYPTIKVSAGAGAAVYRKRWR